MGLAGGTLLLLAVLVAACGQAAPTAQVVQVTPTQAIAVAPSSTATVAPTEVPPTAAPAEPTASGTDSDLMPELPAGTAISPELPAGSALPEMPQGTGVPPVVTEALGGLIPGLAGDEAEVELEDFQFQPKVLTVRAGTTVKFSNKDDAIHTVTSDTGLFDSGDLARDQEFQYTFTAAGEYPYYCRPHGGPGGVGMSGTIIVTP